MTVYTTDKSDNSRNFDVLDYITMYQVACKEITDNLPLVKCIFNTNVQSYLYGGFLRWIAEFIYENNKKPTIE